MTTTSGMPAWLRQVPMKTVGVLCATHIFGKNIESRQVALAGKWYLHNAVENVVGYVLNPILPPIGDAAPESGSDADNALRNIRDCFNFIFHIQVEYFKILQRLRPERFPKQLRSGVEFNLNWFMAKGPTLINSEKRYLILSRLDGAQPFDLNLDWEAEFDWVDDEVRRLFRSRLRYAQDAYADILALGQWYAGRDRNLILPIRTIMDDLLSHYFEHLGLAAYLMAKNGRRREDANTRLIRDNLEETCRHLERFCVDMLRLGVFSIVKHDVDKLNGDDLDKVVGVRAGDDVYVGHAGFESRREGYASALEALYKSIGFEKN